MSDNNTDSFITKEKYELFAFPKFVNYMSRYVSSIYIAKTCLLLQDCLYDIADGQLQTFPDIAHCHTQEHIFTYH